MTGSGPGSIHASSEDNTSLNAWQKDHLIKTDLVSAILGIMAILFAWFTILLAIHFNPWFRVDVNALSDLGGRASGSNSHPYPSYPFVYNGGIMITGGLIVIFSASVIRRSAYRTEILGFSFLTLSGVFLALVGLYHEGMYPHVFLAEWFFLLGKISFLIIGAALIIGKSEVYGISMVVFNIIAWIIEVSIKFTSVAESEIYGIIVLDILIAIYIMHILRRHRISRLSLDSR
ncbi:MAG: DUF998 domain-containing protein [Thermoplasmata archaeon]